MRIAQSLYEGVDLPGQGSVGLITYMRTDSLRLAPESIAMARKFIEKIMGRDFCQKNRINTFQKNVLKTPTKPSGPRTFVGAG